MAEAADGGCDRSFSLDEVQRHRLAERDRGGVDIAHLEAPQHLLGVLPVAEQVKVQQMDADGRAEQAAVVAGQERVADQLGQIVRAARAPGAVAGRPD